MAPAWRSASSIISSAVRRASRTSSFFSTMRSARTRAASRSRCASFCARSTTCSRSFSSQRGLAQLVGKRVDRVLQHRAELFAVHRHRRRHRKLARVLQHLLQALQQGSRVGNLVGLILEHRHVPLARNSSMSRSFTCFGTMADTSPPKRATSRTRLDERNEYCGLVDRKKVSIPESFWFICAIWSS